MTSLIKLKLVSCRKSGKAKRLNPATTEILHKHIINFMNNKEMSVEEFKKVTLGKEVKLPENILFESSKPSKWQNLMKKKPLEVIKLSELEKYINDPEILSRAREMSKIQPERMGEAVLTKQQLLDVYNKAEINNPKLLDKVFTDFTNGANKSEYRYVSNKKLYSLKGEMEQYIETICKSSKDGKINQNLLNKVKNKNLLYNGINFIAGFGVAAAFLSTYIPKIQYYVTKKTTGVDAFPGVYDFEHNKQK